LGKPLNKAKMDGGMRGYPKKDRVEEFFLIVEGNVRGMKGKDWGMPRGRTKNWEYKGNETFDWKGGQQCIKQQRRKETNLMEGGRRQKKDAELP